MKLRNKKTGEIGELKPFIIDDKIAVWIENKSYPEYRYNSLAELNEDWEDYEEPKNYWTVECGVATEYTEGDEKYDRAFEAVGLKFDTKEECERAIEKLKAWKRLKDKGFRFEGWEMDGTIWFETKQDEQEWSPKYRDDLDLLFGGEE